MAKEIKTAYELACERVIGARTIYRHNEAEPFKIDFVDVPEFSDRADKVIEIRGFSDKEDSYFDEKPKEKIEGPEVPVVQSQTVHYDNKFLEVCWNGNVMDYSGYAKMNRNFVFGLSNRNVKVKVQDPGNTIDINEATQKELIGLTHTELSDESPKVFSATVPIGYIGNKGRKILYTMIENSQTIHPIYRDKLNGFDEIWVPSKYGQKLLKDNKVNPNVYVMPLGVDTKRYSDKVGLMDFNGSKSFRFLSVFKWGARKNYKTLLRAYMQEFSAEEDVSLILVTKPLNGDMKNIVEEFNGIKATIDKTEETLPHIMLYSKKIHEKDMPRIYASCHAFVLISHGEGFGLPFLEAGASNIPVIASNVTAQTDFLNKDNAYLVDPDDYVKAEINGKLSQIAKSCYFYENQVFPEFGENALNQTRQHMREVYINYSEAKKKANKLQQLILNNYSWDQAIEKVYNRIREIGE